MGLIPRRLLMLSILVLLILQMLTLVPGSSLAKGSKAGQPPVEVPPIGKPIDVILIMDQSGSEKQTDPNNVRISAANFMADFIAQQRTNYFDNRMGVVNFGSDVGTSIAPTALNNAGLESVKALLKPEDLGNTNFLAAFEKTAALFEQSSKDEKGAVRNRKKVVVLFTDGEPDLGNGIPAAQLFPEIVSYYQNNLSDAEMFLVVVDQTGTKYTPNKAYWDEMAGGRTLVLQTVNENDLNKFFAEVVSETFSDSKIEWFDKSESDISVEPYLESMNCVLLKQEPGARIEITDDKGKVYNEKSKDAKVTSTDTFSIFTFYDPHPGTWHYRIIGQGKATVGFNKIPIKMRLIFPNPDQVYPLGRPFHIDAIFLKRDKTEVKEIKGYPLFPGATLKYPDGSQMDIKLNRIGAGTYQSQELVQALQKGDYSIRLYLKGDISVLSETQNNVRVDGMPYLKGIAPSAGQKVSLGSKISFKAQMMLEENPLTNSKLVLVDDPRSIVTVTLVDAPSGQHALIGTTIKMEPDPKDTSQYLSIDEFSGTKSSGAYVFSFVVKGTDLSGNKFSSVSERASITVYKTFWQYLVTTVLYVLTVLGLIIALLLVIFFAWYLALARMEGSLSITNYTTDPPAVVFSDMIEGSKMKFFHGIRIARSKKVRLALVHRIGDRSDYMKGIRVIYFAGLLPRSARITRGSGERMLVNAIGISCE